MCQFVASCLPCIQPTHPANPSFATLLPLLLLLPWPLQVLDEQLTDLLRCLPDNPAMHEKVLDSIFSIPSRLTGSGGAAAAALEAPGAPIPVQASQMHVFAQRLLPDACSVHDSVLTANSKEPSPSPSLFSTPNCPLPIFLPQMAAREHVLAVLKECFQRHGAVGMCSQELGLADGEVPPGAVQLLTPAGTKLALRWELRQAFAAWFMQQLAASGGGGSLLLDGLRRYEVAAVQRRAAGQGLPRSFLQADLDFVLPGERTTAEQLLGDAEVGGCASGADEAAAAAAAAACTLDAAFSSAARPHTRTCDTSVFPCRLPMPPMPCAAGHHRHSRGPG